jgi:hypothetical protein
MKIAELLPCGRRGAPGCVSLQAAPNGKIRVIWWTATVPDDVLKGWTKPSPSGVYISNITEEDCDADLPEPLVRALIIIVTEVLSNPKTAGHWHPGSMTAVVKRARTVLDLRNVSEEGYDKALRTKGRLGPWLHQ